MPVDQLLAQLEDIHRAHPDKTVVIKGDRRVEYSQLRRVVKLVNQAGFSGVSLVFPKKRAGG